MTICSSSLPYEEKTDKLHIVLMINLKNKTTEGNMDKLERFFDLICCICKSICVKDS